MKVDLEAPTSEDFKDISKMISRDNHKSKQKKQKQVEKVSASKDEEITHLKNHSQDPIAKIKKFKKEKIAIRSTK